MTRSSMNLLTYNVGSLVNISRRIELSKLLDQFEIDIAFLQELHVSRSTNVFLENFFVIRDDSSLGVGLALRKLISYSRVSIPNLRFQNIFVEMDISINGCLKKILFGSIYFQSNCSRQIICSGLTMILNFSQNYEGLILGGDLNSKNIVWGDNTNNFNGEVLQNWLQNESFSVTRICDPYPSFPGGSSHLDHFIISNNFLDSFSGNCKTFTLPNFSDHIPLKLQIIYPNFNLLFKMPESKLCII